MYKRKNKENGITMITLAVTIIVLIILAGVSINTLIGDNGIITKARQARENIELSKIKEEEQLNNLYEEMVNGGEGIFDDTTADAIEKLENFRRIIATAITNEGVQTEETDTAETMAENIGKILQERTKNATATADNISEGKTAWVNGKLIIGNGVDNDKSKEINEIVLIKNITGNGNLEVQQISYTSDGTYSYLICDAGQDGKTLTNGKVLFQSELYSIGGAHKHQLSIVQIEKGNYVTVSGWCATLYGMN